MRKSSVVWDLERSEMERIVAASATFSEVLRHFGLSNVGGNCRTLKRRLDEEGISYAHIPQGRASSRGRAMGGKQRTPLEKLLQADTVAHRFDLKIRLLQEGMLVNSCALCGLEPTWNGAPLVLVLDHINGVSNDNRLENLRLLCPNCHSQTETFAGRNKREGRWPRNKEHSGRLCRDCQGAVSLASRSGLCAECFGKQPRPRKAERPERQELLRLIAELGYTGVGRRFGVSDNAVRKWMRSNCDTKN